MGTASLSFLHIMGCWLILAYSHLFFCLSWPGHLAGFKLSVARSYDSSREMLRAAKVILKINFPSIMKRAIFQAWQLLSGPKPRSGKFLGFRDCKLILLIPLPLHEWSSKQILFQFRYYRVIYDQLSWG